MRKLLLTSAGFDNPNLQSEFLRLVQKPPEELRALFVPTAAISPDAVAVLPKCMDDLLDTGIPPKNIIVYDLHTVMTQDELQAYDAIYFCGGSPSHLLARINEIGFRTPLREFVEGGGVYVGVSAGSIVAAKNLPDNLGYLDCFLGVHRQEGTAAGEFDPDQIPRVDLTDSRAVLIERDCFSVIE